MVRWKRIKSRYLIRRWWMNLREDHVRLPNGEELDEYHILEYPDWTCVVCRTDDDHLVFVKQYRYAIDAVTLEFPGGAIDPDEDPEIAARRELLEETGFEAGHWSFIGKCAPDPARHTHWAWIYFASGGRRVGEQKLDPAEDMSVQLLAIDDALDLASRGEISHGIHLTALFWSARKGMLDE